MAKYVVCEGEIIPAVDNLAGADLTGIVKCSTGWVIKSEPDSSLPTIPDFNTSGAAGAFDLVFVVALFIAFCSGFHKGGQR